jgi:hypothetical protein
MASRASRRLLKDFLLKRVTSTPVSSVRHFSSSSSSETAPKIPHFSKKVTFFLIFFNISGYSMRDSIDSKNGFFSDCFSVFGCIKVFQNWFGSVELLFYCFFGF